jgi:hypothetical protein
MVMALRLTRHKVALVYHPATRSCLEQEEITCPPRRPSKTPMDSLEGSLPSHVRLWRERCAVRRERVDVKEESPFALSDYAMVLLCRISALLCGLRSSLQH